MPARYREAGGDRHPPGSTRRRASDGSASAAKKPVGVDRAKSPPSSALGTSPARGATTPKRSPTRSTSSSTLWQSKSGGDDQRDTQHARPPAGVTRNSGSPYPVMDELEPVPSTAPDRATLTDAEQ